MVQMRKPRLRIAKSKLFTELVNCLDLIQFCLTLVFLIL